MHGVGRFVVELPNYKSSQSTTLHSGGQIEAGDIPGQKHDGNVRTYLPAPRNPVNQVPSSLAVFFLLSVIRTNACHLLSEWPVGCVVSYGSCSSPKFILP